MTAHAELVRKIFRPNNSRKLHQKYSISTLYGKKSTFLPYCVKKHHSTLKMDTFKGMLLLSYLTLLENKPHTCL